MNNNPNANLDTDHGCRGEKISQGDGPHFKKKFNLIQNDK